MNNIERTFNIGDTAERGYVPLARDILSCMRDSKCSVYIEKDGRTVSAGSMVGILSLGLQKEDTVKATCSGTDEFEMMLCLEKIGNVVR